MYGIGRFKIYYRHDDLHRNNTSSNTAFFHVGNVNIVDRNFRSKTHTSTLLVIGRWACSSWSYCSPGDCRSSNEGLAGLSDISSLQVGGWVGERFRCSLSTNGCCTMGVVPWAVLEVRF